MEQFEPHSTEPAVMREIPARNFFHDIQYVDDETCTLLNLNKFPGAAASASVKVERIMYLINVFNNVTINKSQFLLVLCLI